MNDEGLVSTSEQLYRALSRHAPAVLVLFEDEEPQLTVPVLRVPRHGELAEPPRLWPHCRYRLLVQAGFGRSAELLVLAPLSSLVWVACPFSVLACLTAPLRLPEGDEDVLALSWPGRVRPGLYVGDFLAARNPWVAALGVAVLVDASQLPPARGLSEAAAVLRVAVHDDERADLAAHFEPVSRFLAAQAAGAGALVVCAAGVSRSCALVAAHLMLAEGCSLAAALASVRQARPAARPNRGFLAQLLALELRLRGERSATIYELDRIDFEQL